MPHKEEDTVADGATTDEKSLEDYTRVMRERYARHTEKPARQKLLDEYSQTTGLERKYANKVLRGQRRRGPSGAPWGASSRYTRSDLHSHDPIAMRASIEAKLRALYSQRAQLQAEEDDDMEAAPESAPPSSVPARGMAGLRCVRSVASGSLDSRHSSPPSPVRSPTRKQSLPTSPKTTKAKPITVSPIVRHRAAS